MRQTFLRAEWRNLVMANYEIDPSNLLPYLPAQTELDFWNGKCFISLVGFMFLNTQVLGIKIPFHINFEEVNLRFYVRYKEEGEWKRGVVFIKEIVPKAAISFVANNLYGENYVTLPMRHSWEDTAIVKKVAYEWQFNKEWNYIKVETEKEAKPIVEGSEAAFITEHYWGYTQKDAQTTSEYQVEHPKWNIYEVLKCDIHCDVGNLYGVEFVESFQQAASSIFMADGSKIEVKKGSLLSSEQNTLFLKK